MRNLVGTAATLVFAAAGAAGAEWVVLRPGSAPGAPPEVRVLASDIRAATLEVLIPGYWTADGPGGRSLALPGRLRLSEAGAPELPLVGCTVVLPAPGQPELRLIAADFQRAGGAPVRLSQGPTLDGAPPRASPLPGAPDDEPFPPAPARVAQSGEWREAALATLQVFPFRARADGTSLEAASRMVVEVLHPVTTAGWPAVAVPGRFRSWLERAVVNPEALGAALPVAPLAQGPEYLVLCPPALAGAVQPLLDWRAREGLRTELIPLAAGDPMTVKGLIQARYALGGLLHVVLVGDHAEIPSYVWNGIASDAWYACLTGAPLPDLYPDVGLGRLSGSTPQEIGRQVDRILAYETQPPPGGWCERALLVAHQENGAAGAFSVNCEKIAAGPLGLSGWSIVKQYGHLPGVDNFSLAGLIDSGAGLVLYRGHGGPTEWAGWCPAGSFAIQHVAGLKNGPMTPVVLSIGCLTGQIAQPLCFGEAWLRAAGGAVAALGATDTTYTQGNDPFALEMSRALFQDRTANLYGFYASGLLEALKAGHPAGTAAAASFCWLGDPCTELWLSRPAPLAVAHPSAVETGVRRIEVSVSGRAGPLQGARICLSKGSEYFAVSTADAAGKAVFTASIAAAGTILVTVTASDHLPYLGKIQANGPSAPATIVPDGLGAREGSGASQHPCRFAPARSQHLYDPGILMGLGSGTIKTLRLRRDGTSAAAFVAHALDLTVHLSSRGVPAARDWSRASYSANRGSDWTLALQAATVHYAAEPQPAPAPAPFSVLIPLASSFPYEKGRPLLVQFDCADRPGGTGDYFWLADGEDFSGPGAAPGTWAAYATGCPPGRLLLASVPAVAGLEPLALTWYSGAGYGIPALWAIGTTDTAWGPLPLPFPLAAFGAPGCHLLADWALVLPGATDPAGAAGRFRAEAPVPHDPAFAGARLHAQCFVLDRTFNPAGLMASEGVRLYLGGYAPPPPALELYTYNETAPFSDAPKYFLHTGLVLEVGM